MSLSDFVPRRHKNPPPSANLPEVGPIPRHLRREPVMTENPLEPPLAELGQLAAQNRARPVTVHTDDAGPVPVDLAHPPENAARIAELIDQSLNDYRNDLLATGRHIAQALESLNANVFTQVSEARAMVETASAEARKLFDECQRAGEMLTSSGHTLREQHRDFLHLTRNAMVAVLAVKATIGTQATPRRDDDEVATAMARDLLDRIKQVAPKAAIAEPLAALIGGEKEVHAAATVLDQSAALARV